MKKEEGMKRRERLAHGDKRTDNSHLHWINLPFKD